MYYYRARWYDSNTGRFISEDPIGFQGGDINLYGYVKNKPISRKDPSGLDDADIAFRDSDYYKALERQSNDYWQNQLPNSSLQYNYGCSNSGLGIGGLSDFARNYSDMRTANTKGADKFFHCMANCQSSSRGSLGNLISNAFGEIRELTDQYIKGDSREACDADRFANQIGRYGGRRCQPCEEACSQFRPNGLTYPVPQPSPVGLGDNGDCGKYGNWRCK